MAQHRKGDRFTELPTLPPHPEDVRALERIHFNVSEWDQLTWYVQFAQKDLDRLSPGELLSVREDVRAVDRTLVRQMQGVEGVPGRSDEEIRGLQALVCEKLTELADTGIACLGPFQVIVTATFLFGREQLTGDWFQYRFAQLLKRFCRSVRRCPHCQAIFVQSRRNALFCSRTCQSRAVMKKIRATRKGRSRTKPPRKKARGRGDL